MFLVNSIIMRAVLDVLFIAAAVFLLLVLLQAEFGSIPNAIKKVSSALGFNITNGNANMSTTSEASSSGNSTSVTVITTPHINQSSLANYTLQLINKDREQYGLAPVKLSNTPSAQQHSNEMLYYDYFSHWNLLGMKPYMRYTLLGGTGSVTENVAYESQEQCTAVNCSGTLNPEQALQSMEYSMMYNDSICCNNGHRDNILDPNHNEVSIGVAYNSSNIYLTEDFINNYTIWRGNTPSFGSNGEIYLYGMLSPGYKIYQVYVSFDPPLVNLTRHTVPSGPYSYGSDIAGIVSGPLYFYKNISTVVADVYNVAGENFTINFNIENLIKKYGPGEYTEMMILNNTGTGSSFVGSTYTIFINRQGLQYVPKAV